MRTELARMIGNRLKPLDDVEGKGTISDVTSPAPGVLQVRVTDARSNRPRYFTVRVSEPVS